MGKTGPVTLAFCLGHNCLCVMSWLLTNVLMSCLLSGWLETGPSLLQKAQGVSLYFSLVWLSWLEFGPYEVLLCFLGKWVHYFSMVH